MLRLVLFLAFIVALASGLAWLADRPGLIVVNWEGYQAEVSVFHAVVALAFLTGLSLVIWSVLRHIWESPAAIGGYFNKRRQKRGLDALSTGMIAIGAGDRSAATRYAIQARKSMPNEPLTHLLRAQAAQLSGDKATARRIYESMLASTDTEQLGLRGLFLEAQTEGETEAAKQFAERAVALNPQLSWPVDALFDIQCRDNDWAGALETLAIARKHGHVEKASAERRRAVLLTAQAQDLEDKDPERALNLALDAHKLAPGLVPAAAIAGRLLASRGSTPKAAKILQKAWQKAPHPDIATAFAYARLGDSPKDRLDRVKTLAQLNPHSLEGAVALANAAIEAKDFDTARSALEPLKDGRLTQRACTLMARIEGEEHGDKGAVREWLARAVNAPRDPAWTADGVVSEHWAAVSPVTGALDAFQWRVPVESMEKTADEIVARKLEELVALGAPAAAAEVARDVTPAEGTASVAAESPAKGASTAAAASPTSSAAATPRRADVTDADIVEVSPSAEAKAKSEPAKKKLEPSQAAPARAETADTRAEPAAAAEPKSVGTASEPAAERSAKPAAETVQPVSEDDQAEPAQRPLTAAEERSIRAASAVRPSRVEGDDADDDGPTMPVAEERAAKPSPGSEAPKAATAAKPAKVEEALSQPTQARSTEPASQPAEAGGKGAGGEARASAAKGSQPSDASATSTSARQVSGDAGADARSQRANVSEARIFVSPRAPDDPGPEGDNPNEIPTVRNPYRALS